MSLAARAAASPGAPVFTFSARTAVARLAPRYVMVAALPGWALLALAPVGPMPSACFGGTALSTLADPGRLAMFLPAAPWFAHWLAMISAMMLPLALPMMNHVEARSFPHRRAVALAAFLAGHGAIWMAAGIVYYAMSLAALSAPGVTAVLAAALCIAWQLHPARARMLMACHRTRPLAAHGLAAVRSAGAFGTAHGLRCAASCGHLMLPLMFGGHALLPVAAVTAVSLHERSQHRFGPRAGMAVLMLLWATTVT